MVRNALRVASRRLPVRVNFGLSLALVSAFFPLSFAGSRVPGVRRALPLLPIAARHLEGLSLREQWEWTLLDILDWYSPAYEIRQTEEAVFDALREAGVTDIGRTAARGLAIVGRRAAVASSSNGQEGAGRSAAPASPR